MKQATIRIGALFILLSASMLATAQGSMANHFGNSAFRFGDDSIANRFDTQPLGHSFRFLQVDPNPFQSQNLMSDPFNPFGTGNFLGGVFNGWNEWFENQNPPDGTDQNLDGNQDPNGNNADDQNADANDQTPNIPEEPDSPPTCLDSCRYGAVNDGATCQLWDANNGTWIDNPDPSGDQLLNRARHYTTWLSGWMMPAGGVMATEFTDANLNEVRYYGGRRDSAIWTGAYLAAESLHLLNTNAPDAERAVRESVETLHRWWTISGDRGYLARYAAPADSPATLIDALLGADDPEVHRDVMYGDQLWHWRGNISRDQYQGVILGYSLAYEATPHDPAVRELIRHDVVEFVEQLMSSKSQKVSLMLNGRSIKADVTIPYAVFSQADAPNGTPALTLNLSPFDAAGEGVLFFLPNAADLVRQLPGFRYFPDLFQPTQAIQLGAIFRVALQVTDEVPEYAERRQRIAEHYERNVDKWLDIAAGWRNTNRCDSGYFGLNIGFMPLYSWTRLETDPRRKERLQYEILRDRFWAEVADHKNVFFAFIYASQSLEINDALALTYPYGGQLSRFPVAPNLSRSIDLRGVYPESTTCPGISAEAVNVDERPAATFAWERHPWKLQEEGSPNLVYGGVDYLLAYWMGRHHGFIADDAPGTCLLWK